VAVADESIDVLVERIDGNVRHLRAEFDKQAETIPVLKARIESLETDRTWVKGVLAAVVGLLGLLNRKEILALFLGCWGFLLAGCVQAPPLAPSPPRGQREMHWAAEFRPVSLIVSSALSKPCVASVMGAMSFWYVHGATYVVPAGVVSEARTSHDEMMLGEIAVSAGEPTRAVHAAATLQYGVGPDIYAARVVFRPEYCDMNVAAHELGHALGLTDVDAPGNVMHWEVHGIGFDVTPEQLAAIR
jgi:hypothetical protein